MHERGRSICYHSRDYGPNWTPLGPITITNLQTQGGHRLQNGPLGFQREQFLTSSLTLNIIIFNYAGVLEVKL